MGNVLVIKGADFSKVAVGTVDIIKEVDMSDQVEYYTSYGGSNYTLINLHGWMMKSDGNSTVATKMIPCDGAKKLRISMVQFTSSPSQGLAFYSDATENNTTNPSTSLKDTDNLVKVIPRPQGSEIKAVVMTYDIPEGAKFFRTTYFTESLRSQYGELECVLIY